MLLLMCSRCKNVLRTVYLIKKNNELYIEIFINHEISADVVLKTIETFSRNLVVIIDHEVSNENIKESMLKELTVDMSAKEIRQIAQAFQDHFFTEQVFNEQSLQSLFTDKYGEVTYKVAVLPNYANPVIRMYAYDNNNDLVDMIETDKLTFGKLKRVHNRRANPALSIGLPNYNFYVPGSSRFEEVQDKIEGLLSWGRQTMRTHELDSSKFIYKSYVKTLSRTLPTKAYFIDMANQGNKWYKADHADTKYYAESITMVKYYLWSVFHKAFMDWDLFDHLFTLAPSEEHGGYWFWDYTPKDEVKELSPEVRNFISE